MLFCPHHHHHLPSVRLRHRTSAPIFSCLHHNHHKQSPILWTHNSKSASLLHHLKPSNQPQTQTQTPTPPQQYKFDDDHISSEEKVKLLEVSLITKERTPRFPGSVRPTSPSPLHTLFEDRNNAVEENDEEDDEMIMKAIEIRRKVSAEILKEAMMRKGKFGITYATNLVGELDDFIDYIMIEAAAIKRLPEFEALSFNVRARTVINDLNIVPFIRWLKHNGLSYPRIAKVIRLSKGNFESITRFVEWLKSNYVKGEFIGVVLMKAGDNILQRPIEQLDEIVEYLERNGVRRDWMGYVISRCPQLLSYSMVEIRIRVGLFLDMGINEKDFGTMVFDCPNVLGYFTLEEMRIKVNYLKEFGLNHEEVGRLLAFKPQLLSCSIEERLKPLVRYLYYLGISREGMKRMLVVKPVVFCYDMEANIVPKVRFFQDIGIRADAIGNMLVKFPPLLTYSLHKKIRPVVIFLMTKAGVSERDIAKVTASGPELLGCSIVHKLEFNLKYYFSLGIRLHQIGEMIADFPMLLRYNVDLLRPKYRYLRRTMIRPLEDLIEFPRFFSYSLEGRIIPRHKVLVENRVNFKLRYMLACTDEEFEKKVQAAVEKCQRFKSGLPDTTLSSTEVDHSAQVFCFLKRRSNFLILKQRNSWRRQIVRALEGDISLKHLNEMKAGGGSGSAYASGASSNDFDNNTSYNMGLRKQ